MTDLIVKLPKPLEEVEVTILMPPDVYEAEFIEAKKMKGPNEDYISFNAQLFKKDGKKGGRVFDNMSLSENSEWKVKRILMSMGADPKGTTLNITKMLHRKFLAEITVEQFTGKDGKMKNKNAINDYFPIPTASVPSEPEKTPTPTPKGSKKAPEPEPEPSSDVEVSFE